MSERFCCSCTQSPIYNLKQRSIRPNDHIYEGSVPYDPLPSNRRHLNRRVEDGPLIVGSGVLTLFRRSSNHPLLSCIG